MTQIKRIEVSFDRPLPMNDEADEFLTALSIGQKIINSKNDYVKHFRLVIQELT